MADDTEKPKRTYPNSPFVAIRANYLENSITVISYAEAAAIAGVAVATIYKWIRNGKLNSARKLGAYRIDKSDLYRLLHTGKNQGTPPRRKKAARVA